MIKKIIEKLFKKKTKIGGLDLDDKSKVNPAVEELKPIIFLEPNTSANSAPKDIKIVPSDPKDQKLDSPKPKVQNPEKKTQARKPGRPKGQTSKSHGNAGAVKKTTPKNKPNSK